MSFELKRKESVSDGICRIIGERIERGLSALTGKSRKTVNDEAVHEARKRFKEVRGALRLIRGELREKQFDRENHTFRDAGRPLSEVRDAKVMIETLEELADHYKGQLASSSFKTLRAALESRLKEVRKRVLGDRKAANNIVREVRRSLRRLDKWELSHGGWKGISTGLKQVYGDGRSAMKAAFDDRSDELLHEWRKRSKDLRYCLEVLVRAWPEVLEPLAESAHELTNLLGHDHDLAVLQQIVKSDLKDVSCEERELLEPLATQRRSDFIEQARELGRKLFEETDDEFIARIHGYWKAWR